MRRRRVVIPGLRPVSIETVFDYFGKLEDPRVDRTKHHRLMDMLVIAICGVISGANGWVGIEQFGLSKLEWFRTFLDLPNGIPSHDTFGRVFARLNPKQFMECFAAWISSVAEATGGRVIAIDGKTLRRSFDKASSKSAVHMVSAWATENGLVLGQIQTDAKSNEITAIPRLLDVLDVEGAVVTIDAMGCQTKIAKKIVGQGGDYLFSLKGNHETFHQEVISFFEDAERHNFQDVPHSYQETTDGDHGRVETRRVWVTAAIDWFQDKKRWKGLRSFGMVEAKRDVDGKVSTERRYFISSLSGDDADRFGEAVRSHWRIENSLHWCLDIGFREDDSRIRSGNAAENFAVLRHIAINLLKKEKTSKVGIENKRLKAGWDTGYMLKVLFG